MMTANWWAIVKVWYHILTTASVASVAYSAAGKTNKRIEEMRKSSDGNIDFKLSMLQGQSTASLDIASVKIWKI